MFEQFVVIMGNRQIPLATFPTKTMAEQRISALQANFPNDTFSIRIQTMDSQEHFIFRVNQQLAG